MKVYTVGEMASKMRVSVRTLQYYDQIGLLSPSDFTEGGRRLYTPKDCVMLDQILSLKELGFSLNDISEKLLKTETTEELGKLMLEHEKRLRSHLKKVKSDIEVLGKFRQEIKGMSDIDWERCADIIALLRQKNKNYKIIKHFEKPAYQNLKKRYTEEDSKKTTEKLKYLCRLAVELEKEKVDPSGEQALALAKEWWDVVLEITDGDISTIEKIVAAMSEDKNWEDKEFMELFQKAEKFLSTAIENYFKANGNGL